jgi:hypothetical protein
MLSPSNGGSTAISKMFLQHPDLEVISSIMMIGGSLGYLRYYGLGGKKPVVFNKETLGPWSKFIHFNLWPPVTIANLSIIILVRDPVSIWNSWFNRGWVKDVYDFSLLLETFENLRHYYDLAVNEGYPLDCIIFEEVTKEPEPFLQKVCNQQNIELTPNLLTKMISDWSIPWGTRLGGAYDSHIYKKMGLGYANPNIDKSTLLRKNKRPTDLNIPEAVVEQIQNSELWSLYNFFRQNRSIYTTKMDK